MSDDLKAAFDRITRLDPEEIAEELVREGVSGEDLYRFARAATELIAPLANRAIEARELPFLEADLDRMLRGE